ncbi:NUDIX hydrolase [Streptomyces sp. SID13031]|uniref:NUDIX hydrolase n=1 Tax=Streptomyces sp. SID13031 TaxID=2706046 RepID=UPI0031B9B4A3
MTVFPGGGVEPSDSEPGARWFGPSPTRWATYLLCSRQFAISLIQAAVRELFEESGVLLAGATPTVTTLTETHAAARQALTHKLISLSEFLVTNDLVLRADLLRPWARWMTPLELSRRYDTRFFVATAPANQAADGQTSEADPTSWQTPGELLRRWERGLCGLLPSTWATLTELTSFGCVSEVMSIERLVQPIIPRLSLSDAGLRSILPGDPGYDLATVDAGTHQPANDSR